MSALVKIPFLYAQSAGNFSLFFQKRKTSSETICNESCQFNQWLAGLLEADGGFYISKKGFASCEITMHESEVQTLHYIKSLCKGSVAPRTKAQAFRWRLHKKQPLIELCHRVNGHLRTEKTQKQFHDICVLYNIEMKTPKKLCLENAWFSGFFCGDGSFSLNRVNFTATISLDQKDLTILQEIQNLFGGIISFNQSWNGWKWSTNNTALCKVICSYFTENPLHNPYKQAKMKSFVRFLGYRDRHYHLDPLQRKRLLHFIDLFQNKKEILKSEKKGSPL